MNITEARKLCNDNWIRQLNRGESLADAVDHIQNGVIRKGYKVKADNGRKLTKNEIIHHENKAAFSRSFTPSEFNQDDVESIADILDENDFREDKSKRGVIINCYYCGDCLRVDGGSDTEDYESPEPETHCESCFSDAIMNLAM
jgi:hypothetical protein